LLEIAWWNWDIEKITRNLALIVNADVKALENHF
jgi:virginiamycin A acetyltransferase